MQVIKVMNNSLVLAIDAVGNECILMGKGIGYNQALGNTVKADQIEKVFLLKDKQILINFVQLASQLDETYFSLVQEIIKYAQEQYQLEVMDYLYLSLTDHIAFMVKRIKEGSINEDFNYINVANYYKEEYQIGKFAVNLINHRLGLTLPDTEASAIGLHFVNGKLNSPKEKKQQEVMKLVKNIETVIARVTNLQFDRDSFSYSRFLTHLNYFAERVIETNIFSDDKSEPLYEQMTSSSPLAKSATDSVEKFISKQYDMQLSKQESFYFFIHLHRIINETNDQKLY